MSQDGVIIRKARLDDLDAIKTIADANKEAIGFILRPVLACNIEYGWVLAAEMAHEVVGFVNYRHRQDDQTTLYEICVAAERRGNGVGRALIEALIEECRGKNKERIRLKCPIDNEANIFYDKMDFTQVGEEKGRRRKLVVWEYCLD